MYKRQVLLIASPNNPTGNGLTPAELDALLAELPVTTIVLVDEAYASFAVSYTHLVVITLFVVDGRRNNAILDGEDAVKLSCLSV